MTIVPYQTICSQDLFVPLQPLAEYLSTSEAKPLDDQTPDTLPFRSTIGIWTPAVKPGVYLSVSGRLVKDTNRRLARLVLR